MAVGGDIIEVTFNHPTLGTGTIFPMSGEENEYDLGGIRSEDDPEVDGAGNMVDVMRQKGWSFPIKASWDMNESMEVEKIVALASSPIPADWTFGHINGTVYGGKGKPVGDIKGSNNGTVSFKVFGGGKLKKL